VKNRYILKTHPNHRDIVLYIGVSVTLYTLYFILSVYPTFSANQWR